MPAARVALRENGVLYYLLGDHLGSTSVTADSSGAKVTELRYKPWGETRYTYGATPTSFQYTGQRNDATGLYFYNARYYDPALGRFTQADAIVPDPANPQSLNRYSYVRNNPLKYIDPTGHAEWPGEDGDLNVASEHEVAPLDAGLTTEERRHIQEHFYDNVATPLQKMADAVISIGMVAGFFMVPEFLAYAPAEYVNGALVASAGNLVSKGVKQEEVNPLELLVSFYVGGFTPASVANAGLEEALGWSIANTVLQDTANKLLTEQRLPKWYEFIGDTFSGLAAGGIGESLNTVLNKVVIDDFFRSFVVGLATDTITALPEKEQ